MVSLSSNATTTTNGSARFSGLPSTSRLRVEFGRLHQACLDINAITPTLTVAPPKFDDIRPVLENVARLLISVRKEINSAELFQASSKDPEMAMVIRFIQRASLILTIAAHIYGELAARYIDEVNAATPAQSNAGK